MMNAKVRAALAMVVLMSGGCGDEPGKDAQDPCASDDYAHQNYYQCNPSLNQEEEMSEATETACAWSDARKNPVQGELVNCSDRYPVINTQNYDEYTDRDTQSCIWDVWLWDGSRYVNDGEQHLKPVPVCRCSYRAREAEQGARAGMCP